MNATRSHHGIHAKGRTRRRSSRRVVGVCMLAVMAAATIGAGSLFVSGGAGRVAGAAQNPTCPTGTSDGSGGCIVTLPCPQQLITFGSCNPATPPTVDVNPVSYLQDDQYVTVKTTNFPTSFPDGASGGSMRVGFCSMKSPNPANPLCLSGFFEAQDYGIVNEPVSTLTADHATQNTFAVFFDPPGQGEPSIPAREITQPSGEPSNPGFNCDNTSDPCAVEVTWEEARSTDNSEPGQGADPYDSSANTVVMPLNYAPPPSGCPASDSVLDSESSWSVQHFLNAAVGSSCQSKNGVIDLNTATDTGTVTTDFNDGNIALGFVDNPADPTQEATLLGGRGFAYVPIAVSATTVGFLGENEPLTGSYPPAFYSFDLTPDMLAGLINGDYTDALGSYSGGPVPVKNGVFYSDNLLSALATAGVSCAQIQGCTPPPGTKKDVLKEDQLQDEMEMNGFNLLNPAPPGQEALGTIATTAGSFMPDAPSGALYQATSWICQQPNVPMTVDLSEVGQTQPVPVRVTDEHNAATELITQPNNPVINTEDWLWPTPGCSSQSTVPSVQTQSGGNGQPPSFSQLEFPSLQANDVRNYAYANNQYPQPDTFTEGFAVMDSSDSLFYGLNSASLQNSAGNFVTPNQTSVADALENVTPCPTGELSCPQGTFSFDYAKDTTTDAAGAYPMPDITYALVPTSPQPADEASAMTSLLTNLVNFSHGSGSIPLPPGYYPMPSDIYQAALTDIKNDISAAPSLSPVTTTTVPTKSTTSSTPASTSGSTGSTGGTSGSAETGSGASSSISSGVNVLGGSGSSLPLSTSPSLTSSSHGSPTGGGSSSSPGSNATVAGTMLVSLDGPARFLFPALVLLALASLIAGTVLLVGPETRRRRRRSGGSS
jgi:hypothetical protein